MDWNRAALLGAQVVVIIVLGICVMLGHNSVITDTLMVVAGSVTGTGLYSAVKQKTKA